MKILSLLSFILLLQGCGDGSSGQVSTFKQKHFARGVKLISSSIKDPNNKRTMKQNNYTLDSTSRLLIRLGGMKALSNQALVSKDKRMYLVIAVSNFDTNWVDLQEKVEVCPITTNWMMLATWFKAHNLPTDSAKWKNKGGDFSKDFCVKHDSKYSDPDKDTLYFDVSDWYDFYIKSHSKNYGLILKSSVEVTIYGDENSKRAPHFIWQEQYKQHSEIED